MIKTRVRFQRVEFIYYHNHWILLEAFIYNFKVNKQVFILVCPIQFLHFQKYINEKVMIIALKGGCFMAVGINQSNVGTTLGTALVKVSQK